LVLVILLSLALANREPHLFPATHRSNFIFKNRRE
jgi:hypothetical protein